MSLSRVRTLYESANGDVWTAALDGAGKLVVFHEPNRASGGQPKQIDVGRFLSAEHYGPEHEALMALILGN